jgi:hypothetical protein
VKLHQRICFNLIHHRGVTSDAPAIKLFKSFASSLKRADPSLIILPFHASKQHYSSLPTLKHIQTVEENKLPQFFQSYHPRQYYSISGYFHVSSELTFNDLISMPAVAEGLDSNRYFIKACPSQSEEMVHVGVLCYGNTLTFCEDLKRAIIDHPLWSPTDADNPPIFVNFHRGIKSVIQENENAVCFSREIETGGSLLSLQSHL